MSTTKKIIILVVVIAIVTAVYFYYFKKPKEVLPPVVDGKLTKADAGVTISTDVFPLEFGMRGQNIVRLQTALNWIKPTNPLLVDGVWGSQTTGKLVTTLPTTLSRQPITEQQFTEILKMGNAAKGV